MNYNEYIIRDPKVCDGEPVIKGTEVTLKTVLGMLALGVDIEQILNDFPALTREAVKVVIAFAASSAELSLPEYSQRLPLDFSDAMAKIQDLFDRNRIEAPKEQFSINYDLDEMKFHIFDLLTRNKPEQEIAVCLESKSKGKLNQETSNSLALQIKKLVIKKADHKFFPKTASSLGAFSKD